MAGVISWPRLTKWCQAVRMPAMAACALVLAATLIGCARNSPPGTAQRYLDYLRQFNYAACYGMLSEQDKKDRDFSEFLTAIPLAPDTSPLWFRSVLHANHYILGETVRTGDRAVVAVQVTTPNLPLWERELDAAAGPDHIGGDAAERSLDTNDYPKLTFSDQIVLVREHHRWRVAAGLSAQDHLMEQYRAAVAMYNQSDFDGAAKAYRELLAAAADELSVTGVGQMKEAARIELALTEQVIRERPATQAYIAKSLKLGGVAMKMSEDRVPGIFGTIVNGGVHSIDQVALTVTWYEGRGASLRDVFREQHAIVITPLQFTDFTRPVVPFQPGDMRQFGFILTAPAEVQQEASPYVTISAIVFTPASLTPPRPRKPRVNAGGTASPNRSPAAARASSQSSPKPYAIPQPVTKTTPAEAHGAQ